jgi:hypothetical protein
MRPSPWRGLFGHDDYSLARFADHLGKVKLDRLAVRQHLSMIFAGQSGQQMIEKEGGVLCG